MAQTQAPETIETPKAPVSTTYHGVTVTEQYRWLDAASEQPANSTTGPA